MNTQLPSKEANRLWDCQIAAACDLIMCGMIAAFFVISCVA
jgi:hypothetical protein